MTAWPKDLQSDNQLVTAFTYLKSYARFAQKSGKSDEKPLPPKILDNGTPVKQDAGSDKDKGGKDGEGSAGSAGSAD